MGWLSRMFGRKQREEPAPPTFEETEAAVSESLSERYSSNRDEALDAALGQLESEVEAAVEEETEPVPVEYHVEEAEIEDLLTEEAMDDHYSMAVGEEVDIATADDHLVSATSLAEDMAAYERVDVPVNEDDTPL